MDGPARSWVSVICENALVRTGSCVDSPIKVVTLYSSILLKPFQAYFEFLAIICIENREEI